MFKIQTETSTYHLSDSLTQKHQNWEFFECCWWMLAPRGLQVSPGGCRSLLPRRGTGAGAPGPRSPPGPAASSVPPARPSLAASPLSACTWRTRSLSTGKSACGLWARKPRRGSCTWRTSGCEGIPSPARGYKPEGREAAGAGGTEAPAGLRAGRRCARRGRAVWSGCPLPLGTQIQTSGCPAELFKCSHSNDAVLCERLASGFCGWLTEQRALSVSSPGGLTWNTTPPTHPFPLQPRNTLSCLLGSGMNGGLIWCNWAYMQL